MAVSSSVTTSLLVVLRTRQIGVAGSLIDGSPHAFLGIADGADDVVDRGSAGTLLEEERLLVAELFEDCPRRLTGAADPDREDALTHALRVQGRETLQLVEAEGEHGLEQGGIDPGKQAAQSRPASPARPSGAPMSTTLRLSEKRVTVQRPLGSCSVSRPP